MLCARSGNLKKQGKKNNKNWARFTTRPTKLSYQRNFHPSRPECPWLVEICTLHKDNLGIM